VLNVHRINGKTARKKKNRKRSERGSAYELQDGNVRLCRHLVKVDVVHTLDKLEENNMREKQKDRRGRVAAVEERDGVLADCISLRNV
jgi:hypothetical protein